jgi:hypothetical protein
MRAWPGFVLPLLLGACAHDFSKFVLPPDDDDGGESGDGAADTGAANARDGAPDVAKEASEDTHVADGPCTPGTTCLDAATSCAGDCKTTETSCESACGGGGFHCKHECEQTAKTCAEGCVTTCTSCAESSGCPATTQCQAAVE